MAEIGTIPPRRRADGTMAYKARIKIMQNGKFAFRKTRTLDR